MLSFQSTLVISFVQCCYEGIDWQTDMCFVNRFVVLQQTSPANQNKYTGIIRRTGDTNVWSVLTVPRDHNPQLRLGPQLSTGHMLTVSSANLAKHSLTNMTMRNVCHALYVLKGRQLQVTAP